MKKLALFIVFGVVGVALSAEEYTIQTISALKESSITPAFEKKVQKTALPSSKMKEGACNIVTVGHYADTKEARKNLKKAKTVAKDAFIRPLNRVTPKVCDNHFAESKGESIVKADQNASIVPVAVQEMKPSTEQPKEAVASALQCPPQPVSVEKETLNNTAVFIYDRNLERKSDIHEAIEYYKNSPYHTFRPVAMQSGNITKGF